MRDLLNGTAVRLRDIELSVGIKATRQHGRPYQRKCNEHRHENADQKICESSRVDHFAHLYYQSLNTKKARRISTLHESLEPID